jgi:hypothetical protein
MRSWLWVAVLVGGGASAHADDALTVRMRRAAEQEPGEPMLHLDTTPLSADAEGGIVDREGTAIDLGPVRIAAEGTWWQSGHAPSAFAEDLSANGWRAAGELSLDLGWFRVGANASYSRTSYEGVHKTRGLFVAKTFDVSRWMRAWIMLGLSDEEWQLGPRVERGRSIGISLGTTFR